MVGGPIHENACSSDLHLKIVVVKSYSETASSLD